MFVFYLIAGATTSFAGPAMVAPLSFAEDGGAKENSRKEPVPPPQVKYSAEPPIVNHVPPPPIHYAPPAPPPPPPPRVPPKAATPKGNPATWMTLNDYPSRALRNEEEGVTGIRLTVGTTGLVESCMVTRSSGSPSLDEATCSIMQRRARFNPATDGEGNPTVGVYSSSVRWIIPRDPAPLPGVEKVTYVIDEFGNPQDCRSIDKEGIETPDGEFCYRARKVEPYRDKDGNPVRRTVTIRMVTTLDPAP